MKKKKVFVRILLITTVAMTVLLILAYALIYFLLPKFYQGYQRTATQELIQQILPSLEYASSEEEEAAILAAFDQENSLYVELSDAEGTVIYNSFRGYSVITFVEDEEGETELVISVSSTGPDGDNFRIVQSYRCNGEERTLSVEVSLKNLTEAKGVMKRLYPIAFLICLFLAILDAVLLSRMFVRPIKEMNETVGSMTQMNPEVRIRINSADELGELSTNINLLYQELMGSIEGLETELTKNRDSENQKIDFLRMLSHEIKSPIAAANALLEGMIYEIPPYDTEQKKYLYQCTEYLEKARNLTKDMLQFSGYANREEKAFYDLAELVSDVATEYRVLMHARQIVFQNDMSESIQIYTNKQALTTVLSNLFSNAVNYTVPGGSIKIRTEKRIGEEENTCILYVENSCIPMEPEQLQQLFVKPYHSEEAGTHSTGMGLFIVHQLLTMLSMPYEFYSAPEGDGMIFKLVCKEETGEVSSEKN